jgi:hypothetical protein
MPKCGHTVYYKTVAGHFSIVMTLVCFTLSFLANTHQATDTWHKRRVICQNRKTNSRVYRTLSHKQSGQRKNQHGFSRFSFTSDNFLPVCILPLSPQFHILAHPSFARFPTDCWERCNVAKVGEHMLAFNRSTNVLSDRTYIFITKYDQDYAYVWDIKGSNSTNFSWHWHKNYTMG